MGRVFSARLGGQVASWSPDLAAACLFTAILIQQWIGRQSPNVPVLPLVLLCIVGAFAALVIHRCRAVEPPPFAVGGVAGWSRWRAAALMAAGLAVPCAVLSARTVKHDPWDAQWLWLGAMALPLVPLAGERIGPWLARRQVSWPALALPAGLFELALLVRGYSITSSPSFVHGDEAACGLFGRLFAAGHTPLLSMGWYGLPMVAYFVPGVGSHLFGDNLAGMRLANAILASDGVVLTYLLGKEWFGHRAGLLGALVLCFAQVHVILSRDMLQCIQGPTCITLTLYLCTLWLKRGGALPALLAGMSLVLDLQVYWGARLAWVLVPCLLALFFLGERSTVLSRGEEFLWLAIGVAVSGLPVAALYLASPGSFGGHQGQMTVLSGAPTTIQHLIGQYGTTNLFTILPHQVWSVLTTFNARGDASEQIGWSGSMLDWITAALLPAALVLALLRWRRWEYAICLLWFGGMVASGALTIDPPWWPRLAGILPVIALMVGVLLAEVSALLQERMDRPTVVASLAIILAGSAYLNLKTVFVDYPALTNENGVAAATLVGNFLRQRPESADTVFVSDGSMLIGYETIRFLAPQAAGCTVLPGEAVGACPNAATSRLFVLLPGHVGDLPQVQRLRPGGVTVNLGTYNHGLSSILAYELPSASSPGSRR